MERYTANDLDFFRDLSERICANIDRCKNCPFSDGDIHCAKQKVYEFLVTKIIKTNADKFKEVFGFPLYEVHQLSAQEEGEWLEHEYQEPDKIDRE